MQADTGAPREPGALAHELGRHGERRAGRERDTHAGIRGSVVEARDDAFAIGEDRPFVLNDHVRGQSAGRGPETHRAPRQQGPDPEPLDRFDLDVDRLFKAGGEHVVVIRRRGAARQHELRQRKLRGRGDVLLPEATPHRIQRLQPIEELSIQRLGQCPGERLIEVVVAVHQARREDVRPRVELALHGRRGTSRTDELRDHATCDDDTPGGSVLRGGEGGERVANPDAVSHGQCAQMGPRHARARIRTGRDRRGSPRCARRQCRRSAAFRSARGLAPRNRRSAGWSTRS